MAAAVDLRRGMAIKMDGELYVVLSRMHVTPGNKRAHVQATMRSIRTGRVSDKRFRSTEAVETVTLDPKGVQFSYKDHHGYHFMDMEDYNTYIIAEDTIGDNKNYLKESMELVVQFYDGNPIEIELPANVTLKVAKPILVYVVTLPPTS
jgi:elongation factor P